MRQALEMALEALSKVGYVPDAVNPHPIFVAITAIKEALAQPEQEPVAWIEHHKAGDNLVWDEPSKGTPLYTKEQPPQRKPLTENEIKHLWYEACQTNLELTSQLIVHLARNIEAAHGIKE